MHEGAEGEEAFFILSGSAVVLKLATREAIAEAKQVGNLRGKRADRNSMPGFVTRSSTVETDRGGRSMSRLQQSTRMPSVMEEQDVTSVHGYGEERALASMHDSSTTSRRRNRILENLLSKVRQRRADEGESSCWLLPTELYPLFGCPSHPPPHPHSPLVIPSRHLYCSFHPPPPTPPSPS